MSHRAKHRTRAAARRAKRIEDGKPADPSRRDRAPRAVWSCRPCQRLYRQPWQRRLHAWLTHQDGGAA